ncbi:hypothetical protein CHLRE_02g141446v5 [Chlamydomonas reinhardtii]|uniref:GIY-YIG domain-containing protein n=1 Tax=Chlamydomonas reinhardtii TaxID=3055 RepID=A0A2K3E491_CHLRE|nr:uncharacterized protein CHLRE_02g141446v5 [Chlamydomonas reinhardtii]PNW87602.1 hypothetical protein CHLRE_02g141446v5 [Chlamydomonas reinhardtii]
MLPLSHCYFAYAGRNAGAGPSTAGLSTAGPSNYGQPGHRDEAHSETTVVDADADAVMDGAYNVSDAESSGATTDASTDATFDGVVSSGDDDAGVDTPVHVHDGTRRRRSARLQALPNVIQRNGAAVQAAAGGTARRRRRAQPVQHEEECSPPEDRSPAGLWQLSWTGGSRNTYSIAEWLAKWKRKTTLLRFDGLLSCALCGFSAFAIDRSMFSAVPTPPGPGAQLPPYAFMMPGCGGTMVEDDRWLVCKQCTGTGKSALPVTASARLHHLPHLTRNYIGTVLNLDPFYQMQLSLVDVGVGFTSSTIGHYIPRFGRPHALATALVTSHGSQQERLAMLPQEFGDLLSWSIDNNPLYASYLSVVERETPASELPFLPPHTVEEIVRAARDRGPLQETADLAAARGRIRSHIAAVVPLPPLIPVRASHAPASFTVGTLETRQGRQFLDAAVAADGRALALGGGGAAAGASNTAAADALDGEAGSGDRDAEGPNADGQADGQRVYVGQTRNLAARLAQHRRAPPARMRADAAAHQPFLDCFVMEVLATADTQQQADGLEGLYMRKLGARGPGGYNKLPGAPVGCRAYYAMMASKNKKQGGG